MVTPGLFTSGAFAGITNPMDTSTGKGNASIGGHLIAKFGGEDLPIDYLFQSFKATNNHGDLVEGKLTNLKRMTGVIMRLYVRGYEIDYRNIPRTWWSI